MTAYGMNFNGMNAAAFRFPSTIAPNTWQYDLFGSNGAISPSIMSPNDSAGAYNDLQLFNFSADANGMLNNSTLLAQQSIPLLQTLNAQLAAAWQRMIQSVSAGGSIQSNIISNINNNNNANNNKKIGEDQIISTLEKMGAGDAVSDRVNQEITIKDKDGKDVKTTILRRLISLCDEYRKDPKNAELSKENYEKIWEIANTYAKTGTISSDEFAALKEIALNPGGKKDDDDEPETVETPMTDEINRKKTDEGYKTDVKNTSTEFKDALFGWGTKYDHLDTAIQGINADNILEVYEDYGKKHGINEGETLIDSIYNDFTDWTNTWYGITGSASTFTAIHDAFAERAQNHISKYGDEGDKLQKVLDNFNKRFEAINDENYDENKAELKSMFVDIIKAIKEAEGSVAKTEKDQTTKAKKK